MGFSGTLLIIYRNAPYVFAIRAAACALATGNTTVIKSSDLSPKCYWAVAKAFADAGLPKGCFNVVSCKSSDSAEVVNAMIEHPAVRKVNFTGSTAVGRQIAVSCAKNLKPCLMELGGKNSAIICEDAKLETAVGGVIAGFSLNVSCYSNDLNLVLTLAVWPNLYEHRSHSCSLRHCRQIRCRTESSTV